MRHPISMTYAQPQWSARSKMLGMLGVLIALGFVVVVGLLMVAVAQTQTVTDTQEGGKLDVRSVTFEASDDKLVATFKMWDKTPDRKLTKGNHLWLTVQPGGDRYYLIEASKGSAGLTGLLTRCDADACDYDGAIEVDAKRLGKKAIRVVAERKLFGNLGDRLEWKGGSVTASKRYDEAPNEGVKVHHL